MKRVKLFFRWLYVLDHDWGVEKITVWGYFYKKRIGIRRAWRISGQLLNILKLK